MLERRQEQDRLDRLRRLFTEKKEKTVPDWYPSMSEVRLKKSQVLDALRDNREDHRRRFEEAMEGYKEQAVRTLEKHIEQIKANDPERVTLNLPLPEDHTDDYDHAISMLEWSQDDEVILNRYEFRTYIEDDWDWKQQWMTTNQLYTQ